MRNILITTGDVDGVGLEVTAKALLDKKLALSAGQILFFTSPQSEKKYLRLLRTKLNPLRVESLSLALNPSLCRQRYIEIFNEQSPAVCVEQAAKAALAGQVSAIVTAPLSKQEIRSAGFKEIGHTEIFKRVAKSGPVFMGFVGNQFHVVLATGHIPLSQVPGALTAALLKTCFARALALRKSLRDPRPVAVLGLNPHAGDQGLIGKWEQDFLKPLIKGYANSKLMGPLVPDAAFVPGHRERFSVFIALYHDQGLIPFKAVHGLDSGVHLSLGLPFIRTSVDHGTAKDIFSKGRANAASMRLALEWADKLTLNSISLRG